MKNFKRTKTPYKKLIEEAASTYEDPQEVINYYYSNKDLLRSVEAAALEDQIVDLILSKGTVKDETVSYEELLKPLEQQGIITKQKD